MKELKQCSGYFEPDLATYHNFNTNQMFLMDDDNQPGPLKQENGNAADITAMIGVGTTSSTRVGNTIYVTRVIYRHKLQWSVPHNGNYRALEPYMLWLGVAENVADEQEQNVDEVYRYSNYFTQHQGSWVHTIPLNNLNPKSKWKVLDEKLIYPFQYRVLADNGAPPQVSTTSVIEFDHVFDPPLKVTYNTPDPNNLFVRRPQDVVRNRIMVMGTAFGDNHNQFVSLNGYASVFYYDT